MKYKPISPDQAERFPKLIYPRRSDNDVEIRQADDTHGYMEPYFCVECPVGTRKGLNAPQMSDHLKLIHTARGDKVIDGLQKFIDRYARAFKKAKQVEKENK